MTKNFSFKQLPNNKEASKTSQSDIAKRNQTYEGKQQIFLESITSLGVSHNPNKITEELEEIKQDIMEDTIDSQALNSMILSVDPFIDEYADVKKVFICKRPKLNIDQMETPWKYSPEKDMKAIEAYNNQDANISLSFFGDFSNNNTIVNNNIPGFKNNNLLLFNSETLNNEKKDSNVNSNTQVKKDIAPNDAKVKQLRLSEIRKTHTLISNNKSEISHINKSSICDESNKSDDDKSDYSGVSSASDFVIDDFKTYSAVIFTMSKIERKVIPKAIEFYLKINQHNDNDIEGLGFDEHFNKMKITEKDIFRRYGKLIDKTFMIYPNDVSQQLIISIDLTDAYIEFGTKYKIETKNSNSLFFYSFVIYSNDKCYTFYSTTEEDRSKWIKELNKGIGFCEIEDLYKIKKKIFTKDHMSVVKARRKNDNQPVTIKIYKKSLISNEQISNIARESTILRTFKHPYLIHFYEKLEMKDEIFIGNLLNIKI